MISPPSKEQFNSRLEDSWPLFSLEFFWHGVLTELRVSDFSPETNRFIQLSAVVATIKSLICIFLCLRCWLRLPSHSYTQTQQFVTFLFCFCLKVARDTILKLTFLYLEKFFVFFKLWYTFEGLLLSDKPVCFLSAGHHLFSVLHFDPTVNSDIWKITGGTFDPFIPLFRISLCGFEEPWHVLQAQTMS